MFTQSKQAGRNRIGQLDRPVAIAMWDFTWLLKHHPLGAFENFDQVLDGLVERGYDAIRIDAFPQFIAADAGGRVQEEFYCPVKSWTPAPWGNAYSMHIRPRQALLEFLPKCRARGVRVGLATWFRAHGTTRNEEFTDVSGFVRAWDETLAFLQQHGLLDDILYVDVLNEYPQWHGYVWLKNQLAQRKAERPADERDSFMWAIGEPHNDLQRRIHRDFMNQSLQQLKARWPQMPFFASLGYSWTVPWQEVDLSCFDAIDMHIWFVHNQKFSEYTGYFDTILRMSDDLGFADCYARMLTYWQEHKRELTQWMDGQLKAVADEGRRLNIPCGNTEGWGGIHWMEHPALDWRYIRESAEICTDLCVKHGYKFICTSNCTQPQFNRLWDDVRWHQQVTSIIRGNVAKPVKTPVTQT